ncbi:MAG: DUF998 domain-containing protein [Chloroflexota bacterium]
MSQDKTLKLTALSGILGTGIIFAGSLITAVFYQGRTGQSYSFANHFVSELGEVGVSNMAWVFNYSVIMGSAIIIVYLLGLAWLMRHWIGLIFALLGLVMGVSGLLVGVFPMNNLAAHLVVALTFFNVGQFTTLFFSVYVLFSEKPYFSRTLAIPGLFTTVCFVIFLNLLTAIPNDPSTNFESAMAELFLNRPPVLPLAIFEWLIIAGLMIWVLHTSVHLWRYQRQSIYEPDHTLQIGTATR